MGVARQHSGSVSLLFTDIEGSTALLESLGAHRFGSLLSRHRELLRAAFAAESGFEVNCEGDSFFVAFPTAVAAVSAASEAQRALADEQWPGDVDVRVRIGIHTGEPLVAPPKYVGLDVHRAARIMQAGHGGQVLLSETTRDLLGEGFRLRDLGAHRLKDISGPQRIYQLVLDGLPSEFPSLRSLENGITNLPVQMTPLIGRARELAELREQLGGGVRLLTLTGPGGTGKTRLAVQAAADLVDAFADGVFFVGLASIDDPALFVPSVARAFSLREQRERPLAETLHAYLSRRRILLLVDNLEQIAGAGTQVAALLQAAPGITVIATSRTPLRVSGEHLYPVPPLAAPDPGAALDVEELGTVDAVGLFVARARAVRPEFRLDVSNAGAVAELCARLDGLPLAIELAAAQVRVLSPQALLRRLDLRLLSSGSRDRDPRQQTLRATLDWSYELLERDDQRLFSCLGIFQGGCTIEAAEAVSGTSDTIGGLIRLVESNMLRESEQADGEPRFSMLETIRAYALERLQEAGERDEIARRHAQWFAAIDERMAVDWRFGDVDLLRIGSDLDNFRAALQELAVSDPASYVSLVWKLRGFCHSRGHIREGAHWSAEAVRLAADLPPWVRARAWQTEASFAFFRLDVERADEWYRKALAERTGDQPDDALESGWIVRTLGLIALLRGQNEEFEALSAQAIEMFRELGDTRALVLASSDPAMAALLRGDTVRARALLDENIAEAREFGEDYLALTLVTLGILELREQRIPEASAVFVELLDYSVRRGLRMHVALSLRGFAAIAFAGGRLETAARLVGAADRIDEDTGGLTGLFDLGTFNQILAPLRALAEEQPDIAAALEEGRAMTVPEVTAWARTTVDAEPAGELVGDASSDPPTPV
jgi:predicted ATPase/class 3 adenylate cyclase